MLIQDNFALSKKLYAINRNGFTVATDTTQNGQPTHRYALEAIWFRKRSNGRLAVFKGILWDFSRGGEPYTVDEFMEKVGTARYGGRPVGCWDGEETWNIPNLKEQLAFVQEVDPYLQNYPAIPSGYEGWYRMVD